MIISVSSGGPGLRAAFPGWLSSLATSSFAVAERDDRLHRDEPEGERVFGAPAVTLADAARVVQLEQVDHQRAS
jgi:hypothetical protein